MLTKIGTGPIRFKDFAVDFGDDCIYIGRKGYPKGFFANAVLNISKDEMTDLLITVGPAFHALQDMLGYGYSDSAFEKAKAAVFELKAKLFKRMPLCLLDLKAEQERLDFVFSNDVKKHLHDYWEMVKEKGGHLTSAIVTTEEEEFIRVGAALEHYLRNLLNFYVYIPMDFSNFGNAILNLENDKLRDLKKRDEHHYAAASDEFFSKGMFYSVRLKQVKKSAGELIYEYTPLDLGEPGILDFDVRKGVIQPDYLITKTAELDFMNSRQLGHASARLLLRLARKRDLPADRVLPLPPDCVDNTHWLKNSAL